MNSSDLPEAMVDPTRIFARNKPVYVIDGMDGFYIRLTGRQSAMDRLCRVRAAVVGKPQWFFPLSENFQEEAKDET